MKARPISGKKKIKEFSPRKLIVRWAIVIAVVAAIVFPAYWFGIRRALFNSRVRSLLSVYVDSGKPEADRIAAREEILELGKRTVPALAGELVKNEDLSYFEKRVTAELLGMIGDPRAITSLVMSVTDDKKHVEAIEKLKYYSRMTEEANSAERLLEEFDNYTQRIADVLGELNHPKTLELVKAKTRGKKDEESFLQKFEFRVMGAMKDKGSVDELIGILRNTGKPNDVRAQAANTLGMIGDAKAVPPLIEALEYKEAAVQLEAARSLGSLRDTSAVRPLITLFEAPAFAKARGLDISIINALGRIGSAEAYAYLRKIYQEAPTQELRQAAYEAARQSSKTSGN